MDSLALLLVTRSALRRAAAAIFGLAVMVPLPAWAVVTHATGVVNGVDCDIWTWSDSQGMPRTVALKIEGGGNAGHGGYAVQMTYYYYDANRISVGRNSHESPWVKVTVNAASESDGGFGYFVSHERYRYFSDGSWDTIADKIFSVDDSPLGLGFAATSSLLPNAHSPTAESFTINYYHYGTTAPAGYNPNTGQDCGLNASVTGGPQCVGLPPTLAPANGGSPYYAKYSLPVTTTWVFQSGRDFPRIDVSVDMSHIIAPSSNAPAAGLVSFDVRGPYGVMVFDDGANGVVTSAMWGDQGYLFLPLQSPITRSSAWNWSQANPGARYNLITTGGGWHRWEMGLYEPAPVAKSSLADGYAAERGYTSATFPSAGLGPSTDQCGDPQTLPSDGTWPYQSVQYSLPCASQASNYLTQTTTGKKIAWGSSSLYGFSATSVYNGQTSYSINNFPPSPHKLNYSVCLVLATTNGRLDSTQTVPAPMPRTAYEASLYTSAAPASPDCSTVNP